MPQKQAIADAGGIDVIATALKEGTPTTQKHASSALWGLAAVADFQRPIIETGAVPPLVALLRNTGEQKTQGYAVATLTLLAEIGEGKKAIFTALGVEPLLEIARNQERAWLRSQAVEVLALLNIKDPLALTGGVNSPPLSPRTPRTGAMSARGGSTALTGATDDVGPSGVEVITLDSYVPPADPSTMLMRIASRKVVEVLGAKPLQLRAGFELTTEDGGTPSQEGSPHPGRAHDR